jgi:hypothetical protein
MIVIWNQIEYIKSSIGKCPCPRGDIMHVDERKIYM